VSINNVRISATGGALASPIEVPEETATYPEADMFGRLPAYGLFCRHVEDLRLCGVYLSTEVSDGRPALVADNVSGLDLIGFRGQAPSRERPVVHMTNARRVFVHGCRALVGTSTFMRLGGKKTESVRALGNDLSEAKVPFILDDNVDKHVLTDIANTSQEM
jgi:hypothetical protein